MAGGVGGFPCAHSRSNLQAGGRGQCQPLQALFRSLSAFKGGLHPSGHGKWCPGLSVPDHILSLADAAGLVGALALFAHLTADTIVNGSATSHLAPTDHADRE